MIENLKVKTVLIFATLTLASAAALAQSPQFSLRSTEGRTVSSAELKGKVVVLSFGGTWVPLTSRELSALQKVADRFAGRGVQVYWVSINSNKQGARNFATDEEIQAFAQKNNLRLTVLRDPEQTAYKAFGLDAVPTVLIMGRDGAVFHKQVGIGTEQGEGYAEIVKALEQALK
ncbi:MAG TPA: TlpA disulfide reductase family protein [Blastocatellia bacterium]|nr:TlpA disulfide reductase family protein [Blastocatellia bacterium]HMV83404.1 TlpA disulfide reductase family protein [Blastocatellia bacterium]HMX26841.1 TlpA disulfide reductase family protein [Blastocatellia bacterium]HMY74357.1 TlpA disulfide reductase family protein [Blastocatellia bacterium]HNG28121.1 TlpA disulfide reductase family protein [Blastocatellia bacterium]